MTYLALRRLFLSVTMTCAFAAVPSPAQRTTISSGVALNGVTIVDTHTGKLTPNMTIVLDGGKITKIGRAGTIIAKARRADDRCSRQVRRAGGTGICTRIHRMATARRTWR